MGVGFPKVFVVNGPDIADYEDLANLPAINSTVLLGNKTGDDLGLLNKALLDEPLGVPSLDAGSKLQIAEMPLATEAEAEDGTVETGLMTPLRTKQAIDALVPTMTGATDEDDGAKGLVPAPSAGDEAKFLTGAGTFSAIPTMTGATGEDDGAKGLVPAPSAGDEAKFLTGAGTFSAIPTMTGATGEDDGAKGLVPAPSAGDEAKFLTGAGTYSAIPKVSMSETEYDTGKLWIDGRPIFGIVVDIGVLPNDDEKRVASGVPVGATVLSVNGYTKGTLDTVTTLCIPSVSVPVFYDDATQELVITTAYDMTYFTESFVVLEYVKEI